MKSNVKTKKSERLGNPSAHQKGGATLIGVVLAAVGTLAATAAINAKVNGAQDQALAAHGSVQSQSRSWVANEAVRRYLLNAPTATVAALSGPLSIAGLPGATATVTSNIPSPTAVVGMRRLVIEINGAGTVGTSTLQSVYDVVAAPAAAGAPGGGTNIATTAVALGGNSVLSGDVNITGAATKAIYVKGTLTVSGTNPTANKICATGDITLASTTLVTDVCTNGNLTVSGSSGVSGTATVGQNVSMTSSGSIATLINNGKLNINNGFITKASTTGNVTLSGASTYVTDVTTQGNVVWSPVGTQQTTIKANGTVSYAGGGASYSDLTNKSVKSKTVISSIGSVTMLQGAGATSVTTEGSVSLGSYYASVGSLKAKGNLMLTNEGSLVLGGTYGGVLGSYANYTQSWNGYSAANNTNTYNQAVNLVGFDPGVVAVTVPTASTFVPAAPPVVDVALLRSLANYAFDRDAMGRTTVDVKNVNGITDGTYFLGKYVINYTNSMDYICTSVNLSGTCVSPVLPTKRILQGFGSTSEALTYSSGTWTLNGTSMAAGIAWFNGNLNIANGTYYNTFMASGNLTAYTGYVVDTSPNYAGYGPVCLNQTSGTGLPVPDFNGIYPTQFCNTLNTIYTPTAAGNVAYIAGSYNGSAYQGGNIQVGGGIISYGSIIAGNQIVSTGASTMSGSLMAAGLGVVTANNMGGTVNINQTNAPSTFSATTIPCSGTCGSSSSATLNLVSNYWARYK